MDSLLHQIVTLFPKSADLAALGMLLVTLPLFIIFTARAKAGKRFALRPIGAYERLKRLVSQATESGRPLHVGMGAGALGTEGTAEAAMGLATFEYVARHAAAVNQRVLGTTAEPTILAAAQGILLGARQEAGFPESYRPHDVTFYGPDTLAYAAGAAAALEGPGYLGSILLGRFGSEGLWLAESVGGQGIPQVGGTSDLTGMALMQPALDETVIGEEVYAAGAYLHRPSHLGSLATEDIMRIVTILVIIVGVVLASLGYWR